MPYIKPILIALLGTAPVLSHADFNRRVSDFFSLDSPDTRHTVPLQELHQGCPRVDCIPAIDAPKFVTPEKATYLDDDDLVLALKIGDDARAYPLVIMDSHEIVNDTVGGEPVVVTWCPLCGSALAFDPRIGDRRLNFGVSGLLHNSDLVMYDRQTRSLWGQITGEAILGKMAGQTLKAHPSTIVPWSEWRSRHPETRVLSTDTGYAMRYAGSVYGDYQRSDRLMFPVRTTDFILPPKTVVFGVAFRGDAVAVTEAYLRRKELILTTVGGVPITIERTGDGMVWARSRDEAPIELAATRLYYFAWLNFHPETRVLDAEK